MVPVVDQRRKEQDGLESQKVTPSTPASRGATDAARMQPKLIAHAPQILSDFTQSPEPGVVPDCQIPGTRGEAMAGPVLLRTVMDTGHYNCRDYYISPHFAPTTIVSTISSTHGGQTRNPHIQHESWEELERRSRSPECFKPKFPLLRLPLELRRQILGYLLPHTKELRSSNPLASHARNFGAVQKRCGRGMALPKPSDPILKSAGPSNIVWQRGHVNILQVCRQLHEECADMIYGENTFLLFVTYGGVTFRFRWLLPSGLAPSRSFDFLAVMPPRYLARVRRVVVHVDHVDSYTGMIKFNVGGAGLVHGLRAQVQRLVLALTESPSRPNIAQGEEEHDVRAKGTNGIGEQRVLAKIHINVSNGNAVLDSIKREAEPNRVSSELEDMLEPFQQLRGVHDVALSGSIADEYARRLEASMMRDQMAS